MGLRGRVRVGVGLRACPLQPARRLPPADVGATRLVRVRVRGRVRVKG